MVPVPSLPIPVETRVPACAGKCMRCGSRKTEARPEWPNEGGRVKEPYVA